VDAPVAPARIVPGHLQHQRPYGRGGPGPPRQAGADRPSGAGPGRRAIAAGSAGR
jgi:hypothetical protein